MKVFFSKLTALEKTAKNLFDTAMRVNDIKIDGEILDSEKLSQMAQKDLPATVELLSKLYTEGKLSSAVLQKMFTGRHFMEISAILSQINGDVSTFVEGIATGVNYSQDFYKKMFDINEQIKLAKNNFVKLNQSGFGLGESLTGSLMIFNETTSSLGNMDGDVSKVAKGVTSLALAGVSANLAFGTLSKTLVPLLSKIALLNPVGLAIATIGAGVAYATKQYYDLKKNVADVNILLDNARLIQSDTVKELTKTEGLINNVKNNLNTLKMPDLNLSQAGDMLDILTGKFNTFKEMLSSVSDIKSIDQVSLQYNIERAYSELDVASNLFLEKQKTYNDQVKKTIESIVKDQTTLAQSSTREFLNSFAQLKKDGASVEEIEKQLYEPAIKKGSTRQGLDLLVQKLLPTLEGLDEELVKNKKNIQEYYEILDKNLNESLNTITKNQEAFSKLGSEIASAKVELFNLTGSFRKIEEVNGEKIVKEFSGIQGFVELFKTAQLEDSVTLITSLKKQLSDLDREYASAEKRKQIYSLDDKELKRIDKERKSIKERITLEEKFQDNKVKYLDKINDRLLKGVEYNKETQEWMFKILSTESEIQALKSLDVARYEKEIKSLTTARDIYIQIAQEITKRSKEEKERTSYQIRYRNYLKETLDVELESKKIKTTKVEQEILDYTYKLKQLKVEQQIAEAEAKTTKATLDKIKISEEWLNKVNNIKDSKSGQDVIDDFYKKFQNVLRGEQGKEQKTFYEALTAYVSALSKTEGLQSKIDLEPLRAINEFVTGFPETIKLSLTSLEELADSGIIPFNNYGDKLLQQIEKDISSNKERIFKAFGISGEDIGKAIEDNLKNISFVEGIKGNEVEILAEFEKLKDKFKENPLLLEEIIEVGKTGSIIDKEALLMKLLLKEQKALTEQKAKELEYDKQQIRVLEKKLKLVSTTGNTLSEFGNILGNQDISNIGEAFKGFESFSIKSQEIDLDWDKLFKVGSNGQRNIAESLNKVLDSVLNGVNFGNIVGTAVGGITRGGQFSQLGGSVGGLVAGAMGLSDSMSLAVTTGASLIGGLFGKGKDDQAEAERRTKQANALYNKNTEALQKLAQNMSNLSGGVDSLNNTLITAVSKIPTIDNIGDVTDAMTSMYKTMEKTRKFNDVAYQVTKTKKSKGFLGIGGGSTSWTETIEVSVNELLRKYGFKGALEDMTTQQIRDFSAWLEDYDMGDSDNFSILADALEDYAEGLDKFDKNIQNFFRDSTMEAFEGISSLEQESLRQQIEDFYKNLGFQIDAEMSKQIDKLAEEMSVMVTIMSDVRGEFLSQWRDTGQSAGSVFLKSMTPYIDAMLGNISQIYYDVYFSGVNENLEKEFKNLSEQLVELKKQGKDLDWSSVTDKLSNSFGNVLSSIIAAKDETASFNEILMELQKQALDAGLSLSEIFDLGLMSGTQRDVMDSFKDALMSGENDGALTSIGEMLGDKIGETMANKMIDNLLSDKVLEFSAQIDKIMSGNMSFDSLAQLSQQALSVGLMMEGERQRLEAIKELFDFSSDIEYTTQNENIEYSSGVSQNVTNVFNLSTQLEVSNLVESDSVERLAEELLDIMLDKLKVDKGIDLSKVK